MDINKNTFLYNCFYIIGYIFLSFGLLSILATLFTSKNYILDIFQYSSIGISFILLKKLNYTPKKYFFLIVFLGIFLTSTLLKLC